MLELRANCEYCDTDLPAASTDACICSYECTFCRRCVDEVLFNVCPNCGGGFSARPVRPQTAWRERTGLEYAPASTRRVHTKYTVEQLAEFTGRIKDIDPENR
ncbi:MAG: DUF1272 domain-containing protein [Burkholderiaceae bacterium]